MEEWKKYKLGEITSKIGSGATPKGGRDSYLGGNIALIRSQNVLDFSFSKLGLAYINEVQAEKLSNVEVYEKDVLLNITGDSVARVCIVPNNVLPARVNQHVAIIRGNDKVDYRYLLYYLQYIKPQLLSLSQGGATRNALTKKMIEELEVKMPSKGIQKEIVSILYALDSKIELNRRINDNLEQQAQALFKAWFVDFEPFKDGKFVESELGMIPEGCRVGKAEDFYNINIGKTPPRKEQIWFSSNSSDYTWVSISDLGSCGRFVFTSSEFLTHEAIKRHNIILVPKDTILLSFKLTIGRVGIAGTELTTNEAIARFITSDENREYTYFLLKGYNYEKLGSTSSIATAVNSKIIKAMVVLMPDKEILKAFSSLTKPYFDQILRNEQESIRLTILRDTLLPKLMSGELKINATEVL
ncbi:restriction endonuclease subunit S [Bacteroides acidifaciens]|uniref:restriction endonuclease subunit S n=1 Tax=Bacteroides acidifaciens TaxID=85831 RepID=UPI0025582578|nr:restriction endonuclease subunit S [Bacteroides acidifaciens]